MLKTCLLFLILTSTTLAEVLEFPSFYRGRAVSVEATGARRARAFEVQFLAIEAEDGRRFIAHWRLGDDARVFQAAAPPTQELRFLTLRRFPHLTYGPTLGLTFDNSGALERGILILESNAFEIGDFESDRREIETTVQLAPRWYRSPSGTRGAFRDFRFMAMPLPGAEAHLAMVERQTTAAGGVVYLSVFHQVNETLVIPWALRRWVETNRSPRAIPLYSRDRDIVLVEPRNGGASELELLTRFAPSESRVKGNPIPASVRRSGAGLMTD